MAFSLLLATSLHLKHWHRHGKSRADSTHTAPTHPPPLTTMCNISAYCTVTYHFNKTASFFCPALFLSPCPFCSLNSCYSFLFFFISSFSFWWASTFCCITLICDNTGLQGHLAPALPVVSKVGMMTFLVREEGMRTLPDKQFLFLLNVRSYSGVTGTLDEVFGSGTVREE